MQSSLTSPPPSVAVQLTAARNGEAHASSGTDGGYDGSVDVGGNGVKTT